MPRIRLALMLASVLCFAPLTGAQTAPAQSGSTIQTNANLVVVDVVVSDTHHNPVHKLTKADFTILEDGKPQSIKAFEEHALSETPAPLPALPKLPAGVFTNYTATPSEGALNILLLDSLNTPLLDQTRVRQQVLEYLNNARPGSRIAIFGLTTRLFILQGFTSNPELLRAVLSGNKNLARLSPLMDNGVTGDYPGADDSLTDDLSTMIGNNPTAAEVVENMADYEAQMQSYQLQLRARYTLDAFNQLARYLSALPGRKNLIWFSGSFPINILPDGDLDDPFIAVASAEDEFRDATFLLANSQVAVYPIDARGLIGEPMMDASNSGAQLTGNANRSKNGSGGQNNFSKAMNQFFQQTASEHSTMLAMAEATGGEAFLNTNGLKEAVGKAVEYGSNYYTIAYTPTNQKWNGSFRKIHVEVAHPDTTLFYRRGYYAEDSTAPRRAAQQPASTHDNKAALGNNPAPYSPMLSAMLRGGPEPTQVIFDTGIRPTAAGTEDKLLPSNKALGKISGPFRVYNVEFAVSPRDLGCAVTQEGGHHCALESEIFVYDDKGAILDAQSDGMDLNITADRSAETLQSGIRFSHQISVPVKSGVFLRIGVRDAFTNRIGAIELPISAVSNLPPLSTPAATSKP